MNDMILILKPDIEALLELFKKCQSAFTGETAASAPAFYNFAASIYPSIHDLLYNRRILPPLDHAFVANDTSEQLLNFQWQTPEPNSLDILQAADINQTRMSRHEVRLVYLLLEELNSFFHQPLCFQTTKLIQEFYLKHADRLAHCISALESVCKPNET